MYCSVRSRPKYARYLCERPGDRQSPDVAKGVGDHRTDQAGRQVGGANALSWPLYSVPVD
jgi:hypothetical protein